MTSPLFEELAAPVQWRTVDFVSDLHLQASDAETFGVWEHYLRHTTADALFILGDLFEVWVGDDVLAETNSFEAQACTALRAASQRLTLHFMQGNRDFLVGSAWSAHTGATLLNDPTVLSFADERYVLSHGDLLCVEDVDYQQFRQQARSPAWQQRFLAQPLSLRREQARSIRNASEARKQSGAFYADADNPTALAWLQAAQAATLIHGHTHRPAEHALDPSHRRIVLSDWDVGGTSNTAAQAPRAEVLRLCARGLERLNLLQR